MYIHHTRHNCIGNWGRDSIGHSLPLDYDGTDWGHVANGATHYGHIRHAFE